jgi:hypothetical protein
VWEREVGGLGPVWVAREMQRWYCDVFWNGEGEVPRIGVLGLVQGKGRGRF